MNFLITGTDTDVGKTVITTAIASYLASTGKTVAVYKPVQSGAIQNGNKLIAPDLDFVQKIAPNIVVKNTYSFLPPVAPSLAASMAKVKIDIDKIKNDYIELTKNYDHVLLEGAGGLLCPIFDNYTFRDLTKELNLPILIVARPDLGTINHTLLTIEVANNSNIEVLGVVISKYPDETNDISIKTAPKMIEELSGKEIIGIMPNIKNIENNPKELLEMVKNRFKTNKFTKV